MRLILLLMSLFLASPAHAWGEFGHRTIAAVALERIKPSTRRAIDALIKSETALETPTCPLKTLQDASVWPDCIKGLGARFDYAFSWHYQNADVCKPFDLTAACKDGNCVSRQIDRAAKLLSDRQVPPRERLMALAFLAHFVGDIHMPLHGGDRSDRGGNDVKAAYGAIEGRMNLHWLWDGPLAERAITTPQAGAAGLLSELSADDETKMRGGTSAQWSAESYALAKTIVYATALGDACGPVPPRAKIDNASIERLIPTARQQIVKAGLRLARMLDEAITPTIPAR
jgi:S1/P1 Nuclease